MQRGVQIIVMVLLGALTKVSIAEPSVADSIIPRPLEMVVGEGQFQLSQNNLIVTDSVFLSEAKYLANLINRQSQLKAVVSESSGNQSNLSAHFRFRHNGQLNANEAYQINIDATGVEIQAADGAGAFYAIQSLFQLWPDNFLATGADLPALSLPYLTVVDQPRFGWRGFMLDEARHFQGMQAVKTLIDQMALLKMNVFHWHLTDDQGWRIEIKKYPKLTEIGSTRKDSQIGGWNSKKRSGQVHAGFYTQQQIKEIVAYAKARHIRVVPEIGMPGHASAAVAAYPELGTSDKPIEVPVIFGKMPDTYNAADDKVYQMLSDILDEVVQLFPDEVIHIGGDEVRFDQWKASKEIAALMQREGLKTMADVQIYFTNRMSKIIETKGRRMMGWNEIMGDDLHGFLKDGQTGKAATLSKDALVHFWKGSADLAENAIKKGHDVVNSWHVYTYLDYGYRTISMAKAYHFDPIFPGLEPQYHDKVKGLGCQMWGEWIPTSERMYKQVFPRLGACAEVGWTALERKDFVDFQTRMQTQKQRWRAQGVLFTEQTETQLSANDFFNQPKIAHWEPSFLSTQFDELTWDVTERINGEGNYQLAMLFNKGQHALEIQSVELYENGKRIAKDRHYGLSGEVLSNVVYKLNLKRFQKGAKYTIKTSVKGSQGTDSFGDVKMWKGE